MGFKHFTMINRPEHLSSLKAKFLISNDFVLIYVKKKKPMKRK